MKAWPALVCISVIACAHVQSGSEPARFGAPADSAAAPLRAIVGEWQSDTVAGSAARSTCNWSPQETAVICEQTITAGGAIRHAVNVYTTNSTTGEHFYYGIVRPGADIASTRLEIVGRVWTYGGRAAAADGKFYRTVNDFTPSDRYEWRTEVSSDGLRWSVVRRGTAFRVHRPER